VASSGSSTWTSWKRRVSAGSFSKYFLYSSQVVAARVRNQLRQARTALMELQKLDPPPFSGLGLYQLMDGLGFSFDLQANLQKLTGLTAQLKADYEAGKRPIPAGQKRVPSAACWRRR
jgi:benzoyl-CoA reductase/2-hydroxyglutaryl-CoA dehydratase subunit BcrC/BadD/HgdB